MVFDNRLLVGFFIVTSILLFYFYKIDLVFFYTLSILILFEIFFVKLIISKYLFFLITNCFVFVLFFQYFELYKSLLAMLSIAAILISFFLDKFRNIFFLISLFLSLFLFYDLISNNRDILYFLILLSFINDTSAYIVGKNLKGPLIAPKISPKKTWSGTIFSMTISFFIMLYFNYDLIFSIVISVSMFFGDLYFSFIKRKFNIKDFSKILSSHGGILDRYDSIFPLTIIFYLSF